MTSIRIRTLEPRDEERLEEICEVVYPTERPYSLEELQRHRRIFPEGQLVAVDEADRPVGMLASLMLRWSDYRQGASWAAFTAGGTFANHDPVHGRTLYVADMMTDPSMQHHGIAHLLAMEAVELVRRRALLEKRGGSRLPGYHEHASRLSPHRYVLEVIAGRLHDPTLSFHLHQGFRVFAVVNDYLPHDEESLGHAALIEWVNPRVATPQELEAHRRVELGPPPESG